MSDLSRLRRAAEDLRDSAAKLAAAIISGRIEDAAYTLNAALRDDLFDVEREIGRALVTCAKHRPERKAP
jgi:hypothetical protein